MKIVDYFILCDAYGHELSKLVCEHIGTGWQPYGYPFIDPESARCGTSYCQAMVKYEGPSNDKD